MDVKVETKCGRCGKREEKTVSLEQAAGMSSEALKKADAINTITEFAATLDPMLHPELIVINKEVGGAYSVHTLDNLCSKADAKRNKGCAARVGALVKEMFAPPAEKKPRQPRKPKEKSAEGGNGPGKGKKDK